MPIYDYACENGHTFEVLVFESRDEPLVCDRCDSPVRKLLSAPVVIGSTPYYSESLGETITSPEHRRRTMRAKGFEEQCGGGDVRTTLSDTRGRLYQSGQKHRGGTSIPFKEG